MKVVINGCYGGFGVSEELMKRFDNKVDFYCPDEYRTNEEFVALVEEMGIEASSKFSNLHVVEVPDEATDWMVEDYDGLERIVAVVGGRLKVIR